MTTAGAIRRAAISAVVASSLVLSHSGVAFARPPSAGEQCAATAEEGQRSRASGGLRAAREKFTSCARKACPHAVQNDCSRWFDEVNAIIPTVIFRAYGKDKSEIVSAHIVIDDDSTATNGLPYALDPGPHVVKLVTDDGTAEARFMIAEGEKNRIVMVSLGPTDATPPPPPPSPPPPEQRGPPPPIAYVGAGLGAAAIITGSIFWGVGASDHANLANSCAPAGTCGRAAVSNAEARLVAGDVLFIAGTVITGVAVYFILRGTPAKTTAFREGFTF